MRVTRSSRKQVGEMNYLNGLSQHATSLRFRSRQHTLYRKWAGNAIAIEQVLLPTTIYIPEDTTSASPSGVMTLRGHVDASIYQR